MKKIILCSLALTALLAAPVFAEELIIKGDTLNSTGKKGPARHTLSESPKVFLSATIKDTKLILNFSDGKQKFGSPNIHVKSGENTIMRPRMNLTVPIDAVNKVAEGNPLLLTTVKLGKTNYKISLVNNNAGNPDVVISSQ